MSGSNLENLSPQIYPQVLRLVSKQISDLVTDPPEGIRVLVNDEDISAFSAVIEGPAGTPYFKGTFYVRLVLSKDFPASPPKAYFTTKIFHPNVSRDGEICVNTLKKDWNPSLGLKHVLLTIKCLLIVPNPESALNEEAGKLLLEHYDEYFKRAKMMTEIHARMSQMKETTGNSRTNDEDGEPSTSDSGHQAKKHAGEKKITQSVPPNAAMASTSSASSCSQNRNKAPTTAVRDKRRTLKRL